MVQIEDTVPSAIDDEDDDEGRGRFGTGAELKQVSAYRVETLGIIEINRSP